MDEPFELPVAYKGKELLLPARLLQLGYSHKFLIDIYGQEIFFEPDEEHSYRALIDPEQLEGNKRLDIELLKAVAEAIQAILK